MPRLKSYHTGAQLRLRDDDLLIGFFTPDSSSAVHHLKLIVASNGFVESGEYFIGECESRFEHSAWKMSEDRILVLGKRLASLGEQEDRIAIHQMDYDVLAYERSPRRTVRFWHEGREVAFSGLQGHFPGFEL